MERIQADVKFLIYTKYRSFIQNKQYDTLTLKLTIRQIFVFVHLVLLFTFIAKYVHMFEITKIFQSSRQS